MIDTTTNVLVLPFAFPGLSGVGCAFGTRLGGLSASPFDRANISYDVGDDPEKVASNRSRLKIILGFDSWQEVRQVHGTDMVFEPSETSVDAAGTVEADGMGTREPSTALVIKSADCQPLLLAHASGKYVGALHVGWRGNVQGFPTKGVEDFCNHYNIDPAEVSVVRGPSLGPGKSRFENFDREFGQAFKDYFDAETETVDLWQMTRDQLREAGVHSRNIYSLDMCTHSIPELFFSYRRNRNTGRQASFIWIRG
jgi:YfiH family protein